MCLKVIVSTGGRGRCPVPKSKKHLLHLDVCRHSNYYTIATD